MVKVTCDFISYLNSDRLITIPRNNQIKGVQHPLNPPMLAPYPYEDTPANRLLNQKYRNVTDTSVKILQMNRFEIEKMYTSSPRRENPNEIDHFLHYT